MPTVIDTKRIRNNWPFPDRPVVAHQSCVRRVQVPFLAALDYATVRTYLRQAGFDLHSPVLREWIPPDAHVTYSQEYDG